MGATRQRPDCAAELCGCCSPAWGGSGLRKGSDGSIACWHRLRNDLGSCWSPVRRRCSSMAGAEAQVAPPLLCCSSFHTSPPKHTHPNFCPCESRDQDVPYYDVCCNNDCSYGPGYSKNTVEQPSQFMESVPALLYKLS